MRQFRIKSKLCFMNSTCRYDYSFSNEEKDSFQPGWTNKTNENCSLVIERAFKYNSSYQLDRYIYNGDHGSYGSGGYVYEFRGRLSDIRSNLSKLHKLGWIDNLTRAVLIQFSLYNPNVQLFSSITFLTEFLSTGGISPQYRFEPINFYSNLIFIP